MSKIKVNQIVGSTKAGVGIGGDNNAPSAALSIESTTQGLLFPRLSTVQRNAIVNPAEGLIVYNLNTKQIEIFNGTVWLNDSNDETAARIAADVNLQNQVNALKTDARFSFQKELRVKKNPGQGEFSSINAALATITNASVSNRYLVHVGPGEYLEDQINIPSFVSIEGSSINTTVIKPNPLVLNCIVLSEGSEISFLSLLGNTDSLSAGRCAINSTNAGNFAQAHKISIYDFDIGVNNLASTKESVIYLEYVDINGDYSFALKNQAVAGFNAFCQAENFYTYPSNSTTKTSVKSEGSNSELFLHTAGFIGSAGSKGLVLNDGGYASVAGCFFNDHGLAAVNTDTGGLAPRLEITGTSFKDCLWNLNIQQIGTTGYFSGFTERTKVSIVDSAPFFVANRDAQTITVFKRGGDFTSIANAVASVTDATAVKPYYISVGPGTFNENQITMKPFVHVEGDGADVTTILANNPAIDLVVACPNSSISSVTLTGATGLGASLVKLTSNLVTTATVPFNMSHIRFGSADTLVHSNGAIVGTSSDIFIVGATYGKTDNFNVGFKSTSISNVPARILLRNSTSSGMVTPYPTSFMYASGVGAEVLCNSIQCRTGAVGGGGNAVYLENGAKARLIAANFRGWSKGLNVANIGSGSEIKLNAVVFDDCTQDIFIDHPSATGNFNGTAEKTKVYVNPLAGVSLFFSDPVGKGTVTVGDFNLGKTSGTLVPVADLIRGTATMGLYEGGGLSAGVGFNLNVAAGFGYLKSTEAPGDVLKRVNWAGNTVALSGNLDVYIYVTPTATIAFGAARPDTQGNILLGRAVTNATAIEAIDAMPVSGFHSSNQTDAMGRDTIGALFASGNTVSENATFARKLDITQGLYYFSGNKIEPAGSNAFQWTKIARNGTGTWIITPAQDLVPNDKYDNNTGIEQTVALGNYTRHFLYSVGQGVNLKRYLSLSQAEYTTLDAARQGNAPNYPSWFRDGIVRIASIIVRQGVANVVEIKDERPQLGKAATGSSAVSDHGALTGLGDDDHPFYTRADGLRPFTGNIDLGTNNINNVGLVDGVDVSAHAARHNFNGPDALLEALATELVEISDSTNAAGINNTKVPRADHQHAHGNRGGGTLHATASPTVNGFMSAIDKAKLDTLSARDSKTVTAAQATSLVTFSNITQLTTSALQPGNYTFRIMGMFQSSATTTGIGFRISPVTATVTTCFAKWRVTQGTNGLSQDYSYDQITTTIDVTSASAPVANSNLVMIGQGFFTVTGAGTVAIQFRSEVAGNAVSIQPGSFLAVESVT